jgi:phosphoribosyl-ATP pyrophosphohydrolase/phosphoribosyl-AMP cyclohydrolase/histidinol dehydrogenase
MSSLLRQTTVEQLLARQRSSLDLETQRVAQDIVEDVRLRGEQAVREHSERLGDRLTGDTVRVPREDLDAALRELPAEQRELLERTALRITAFAQAQRACLLPLDTEVPGGRAGHRWLPVASVGAYAPGGRHPLPSSVLMTVIPAQVAGVANIVVASPNPTQVTLAAAGLAGASSLLAIGGAQAIAALTFGVFDTPADVVVGPGNRWVTAAKKHLVGEVGIDSLAGPSELLVLADSYADAATIAADLLGQAEHDDDAVPILVTTSAALIDAVERELALQLQTLPTAATATASLRGNGAAILVADLAEAVQVTNRLAPEHLELCVQAPDDLREQLTAYGSLFVGAKSAEVFGDYGAGPNHVLPTGGGSRFQAGLSVLTFLRPLTFLELQDPSLLRGDAAMLARLEGLEGHARSAEQRGM